MKRTSTDFLAVMDMTGMTSTMITDIIGVSESEVVDCLRDSATEELCNAVWEILDSAYDKQRRYVRGMVALALMDSSITDTTTLPYWVNFDEKPDERRIENANNRALASALMVHGISARWVAKTGDRDNDLQNIILPMPASEMELKEAIMAMVKSTGKSQRALSLELGKRDTWLNQLMARQSDIATERLAYIADACGWDLRFRKRGTNEFIIIDPDSEE